MTDEEIDRLCDIFEQYIEKPITNSDVEFLKRLGLWR